MSRTNFAKLVRHIRETGRYEPLTARPCPGRPGLFQIINGHHRCEALRVLNHPTAEVVVWEASDEQTDLLLATLNRLAGRDTLDKKLALLRRLSARMPLPKLARLLPQTRGQIERLVNADPSPRAMPRKRDLFAIPMVFFVDAAQGRAIEEALARAVGGPSSAPGRAGQRALALTQIAQRFLDRDKQTPGEDNAAG
jgi:hypothetical protein